MIVEIRKTISGTEYWDDKKKKNQEWMQRYNKGS